jgi:hypothetical protein
MIRQDGRRTAAWKSSFRNAIEELEPRTGQISVSSAPAPDCDVIDVKDVLQARWEQSGCNPQKLFPLASASS